MNELVFDLPNREYHSPKLKQEYISKSGLDQIAESPAHYRYWLDNPTEYTTALTLGSAFHTMVLEPEKADMDIVIQPDSWPTKKECGMSIEDQKEAFRLRNNGKTIVSSDQMVMLREMAKSVEEHTAANFLLQRDIGKAEVTALWLDEETGVKCRARFDWLREDGLIVDLKSTRSANQDVFKRLAFDHRYHVQAAFYMEAYRKVTGKEPAGFCFVATEKEPPYLTCTYVAQPDFIELGRIQFRKELELYAECLRTGEWPGYPDLKLVPLELPAFAQKLINQGEAA